jgi:hypothetical protein
LSPDSGGGADEAETAGGAAARTFIYLIAGWSGFYVMLVELLGGRLIAPYFGSSIYTWGAVIFVFMVGLAIGYLVGGLASMRAPSIARLALILIAAAVSALPIVFLSDPIALHGSTMRGSIRARLARRLRRAVPGADHLLRHDLALCDPPADPHAAAERQRCGLSLLRLDARAAARAR